VHHINAAKKIARAGLLFWVWRGNLVFMRTEIDRGFIAARAQDAALSALRAAVEAVISGSDHAVRAWYEDFGAAHDRAGLELPGKMQLLRDAMERAEAEMPKPLQDEASLRVERDRLVDERGRLRAQVDAMGRAGDNLTHQFSYREAAAAYDAWWKARGGHDACTWCNDLPTRERALRIARYWNRQALRLADGEMPDNPRDDEERGP
jgi:hypothetical protein